MGLIHKHHATKLTSYPISQILATKMRLQNDLKLQALLGKKVNAERARYIADRVGAKYLKTADRDALAASALYLAAGRLTQERFKRLCWCLAAGTSRLKRGDVIKPWKAQFIDEWVPLQVMDVVSRRSFAGNPGANVVTKALAGTCCGMELSRFWSVKFARFCSKSLGFTKKFKLDRIEELVGLRFYGLVERNRSYEHPFFDQIDITSAFLSWNRLLISRRHRHNFECPKKFKHPCYLCPVGYDACPLAVHPRSYVKALCKTCNEMKFTDPLSVTLEICVDCQRSERFSRKRS
jgi:hypothetical protein